MLYRDSVHAVKVGYPAPVLRSAKRAPVNVRLLYNSSDVIFLLFSRRTIAGARFAERSTGSRSLTQSSQMFTVVIGYLRNCQIRVIKFIRGSKVLKQWDQNLQFFSIHCMAYTMNDLNKILAGMCLASIFK